MQVSIIVAMAENNVIGKDNTLPWHLPADLKHFKNLTTGHAIIMGRKTYQSIGRPLPNRTNIVITRNADFSAEGCLIAKNLEDAIEIAKNSGISNNNEIFIIGGATIYSETLKLDLANKIYLTQIHNKVTGDTFFPELDMQKWQETDRQDFKAETNLDNNTPAYSFITLAK